METDAEEREEALWQRWPEGGVLFSKTFPDQTDRCSPPTTSRGSSPKTASANSSTDPVVAEDLIPVDHPIGTKRICTDAGYYETFNRDNVRLVNLRREPIEAITADGVRTGCGELSLRCAGLRDGLRRDDGRDDPDRSGRARAGNGCPRSGRDGPVTFLGLMVPRLPNLFSFSGPGSPSVLANMVLHAEVQVDWVIELIIAAARAGITEVEPRLMRRGLDRARRRGGRADAVSEAQSSWYLGANIDGKKRVFMPYVGGFGNYRRFLDDVVQQGYPGLVLHSLNSIASSARSISVSGLSLMSTCFRSPPIASVATPCSSAQIGPATSRGLPAGSSLAR